MPSEDTIIVLFFAFGAGITYAFYEWGNLLGALASFNSWLDLTIVALWLGILAALFFIARSLCRKQKYGFINYFIRW